MQKKINRLIAHLQESATIAANCERAFEELETKEDMAAYYKGRKQAFRHALTELQDILATIKS